LQCDEAYQFLQRLEWQQAEVTDILLKAKNCHLSRQEAKEITSILIRAQFAYDKTFTIGHRSAAAEKIGHFPFAPDKIFARHEGMADAPENVRHLALKLLQDGSTFKAFEHKGTLTEEQMDAWGLPQTPQQASQRQAGKRVKNQIASVARWRFTLLNHPEVMAQWKAQRQAQREKARKRSAAKQEALRREQDLQSYHRGLSVRAQDIAVATLDKYGARANPALLTQQCTHCHGYRSAWIKYDLGAQQKHAWGAANQIEEEPLSYYCGLSECVQARKAQDKLSKPEIARITKARKAAEKAAEKAAKVAFREAEKAAKKAAREAEKEAKKAAKEAEKEAKKAAKEAERAAKKATKEAERPDKQSWVQCDGCDEWFCVPKLPNTKKWYCSKSCNFK
jgi:hypothetical protein